MEGIRYRDRLFIKENIRFLVQMHSEKLSKNARNTRVGRNVKVGDVEMAISQRSKHLKTYS